TNWSPVPYSPDTGYFYVPGTVRTSAFTRFGDKYLLGQRYTGGSQAAPIGSPMSGTFTAIDSKTNTIACTHKTTSRIGGGGRSSREPTRSGWAPTTWSTALGHRAFGSRRAPP